MKQRINKLKTQKRKALTSTQRSQRRRYYLKQRGITEIRVETSFTEKELFKRIAKATGHNSISEYIVLSALEHGERLGIRCADINAEIGKSFLTGKE